MIKKEFKDIIKPAGLRVLSGVVIIMLFFTALFIFGEKNVLYLVNIVNMFKFLFWVIILWISYNLGINMFKQEQADHAMEYLFSSPLTKTELVIKKLIPRLLVLLFLFLIYFFIYHSHILLNIQSKQYFGFFQILFLILGMFFGSAFLSIYDWGNFKALVWLIITIPGYNLNLIFDHYADKNIVEGHNITLSFSFFSYSLFTILAILGIGFFFVFRNSDIRPQKILKNKYAFISIIPLSAIVLISLYIRLFSNQ